VTLTGEQGILLNR